MQADSTMSLRLDCLLCRDVVLHIEQKCTSLIFELLAVWLVFFGGDGEGPNKEPGLCG